jgi:hypothetical protein
LVIGENKHSQELTYNVNFIIKLHVNFYSAGSCWETEVYFVMTSPNTSFRLGSSIEVDDDGNIIESETEDESSGEDENDLPHQVITADTTGVLKRLFWLLTSSVPLIKIHVKDKRRRVHPRPSFLKGTNIFYFHLKQLGTGRTSIVYEGD